jgi:hypothetical protein
MEVGQGLNEGCSAKEKSIILSHVRVTIDDVWTGD